MTQETRYAIILLSELKANPNKSVSVKAVASQYDLSEKFLELVAAKLKSAGLINSRRGRSGGYSFNSRQPLSVASILAAIDKPEPAVACLYPNDCAEGGACCTQKEIEARLTGQINDAIANMIIA